MDMWLPEGWDGTTGTGPGHCHMRDHVVGTSFSLLVYMRLYEQNDACSWTPVRPSEFRGNFSLFRRYKPCRVASRHLDPTQSASDGT